MILIQTSIYYFFFTFKGKKMQFSPHPLLFFISLIIPFLSSFSLSNSAPSQYSNCAPLPYRCGDTTFTISYPFHIDGRPSYCGNPEYYINCTNMNTTLAITISNQQYQITSIDYNNNLMNIVNKDFISDTGCPQAFSNTTINTNLYQYQRDRNLTVYINCTGPLPIIPVIVNYACLDISGHSYYRLDNGTLDDLFDKCSSTIIVPLGQETANNLVNGNLQFKQALQQGFFLEWTAGLDWCGSCVNSGGICGYTAPDIQHTCFCPNGTSAGYCDSLGKKTHTTKKIVIGVACGFGGFLLACAGCFYFYRRKLKKHKDTAMIPVKSVYSKSSSNKDMESISFNCNTPLFSYEELVEATNGFESSRELGDGGYGTVYKGVLKDGRVVAVKRLYETSYKRVEQFMNEVEILSLLRHPNLVTLYGSTSPNSPHLLLVYEFIPNGTLADHLHNPTRSKSLSLCLRLKMAIDTAASLSYLHSIDIIHRDVKSNNILVDNNFNVKVADFGLSRLFPPNRTHVSTAPQGTPGYLDPEYHRFYQLTDKSDVYSFGVVLMEFIASRPAVDIDRKPNEISLAMAAISKIQKGELSDLIDPYLRFNSNQGANRIITQIAELAFRCLQMDREMRPSIKEVLKELKEIEGAHFDYEEDCCEKKMREEASLLNKSEPGSPETISCTWTSRSTTPSASN